MCPGNGDLAALPLSGSQLDIALDLESEPPSEPVELKESVRSALGNPDKYIPSAALLAAIRTALELRQPLLVTGPPGTGKTSLADFIAHRLALPGALRFQVRSGSKARDLFYEYDAVGRFNAGAESADVLRFVRFRALGKAILFAQGEDVAGHYLKYDENALREGAIPRLSVVLIDEIDKAPRDFPNDILAEIADMEFTIHEHDNRPIKASEKNRPIVVITSNSEKDLPDAFLRRCLYFHIPFPDEALLEQIVLQRLRDAMPVSEAFLRDAVGFFVEIRKRAGRLRRAPGTAELLDWLIALNASGMTASGNFDRLNPALGKVLGTLFKTQDDLREGAAIINELTG